MVHSVVDDSRSPEVVLVLWEVVVHRPKEIISLFLHPGLDEVKGERIARVIDDTLLIS